MEVVLLSTSGSPPLGEVEVVDDKVPGVSRL